MQLRDLSERICQKLDLNFEEVFVPNLGKKRAAVTIGSMVEAILATPNYDEAVKILNIHRNTFKKKAKEKFPKVPLLGRETWRYFFLKQLELKHCNTCEIIKPYSEFYSDKATKEGLSSRCKSCDADKNKSFRKENPRLIAFYSAQRRAQLLQATPKWANAIKIKDMYINCPDNHDVDHYYPLKGETVCGLHVENNLCYISSFENGSKGNKMPDDFYSKFN